MTSILMNKADRIMSVCPSVKISMFCFLVNIKTTSIIFSVPHAKKLLKNQICLHKLGMVKSLVLKESRRGLKLTVTKELYLHD